MTVTSKQQLLPSEEDTCKQNLLEVKWGPEKKIEFQRDPNEELGITVVYGRMYTNNNALGSISGFFIKNIAPNSAAGRTGKFQAGDKILDVCGTYVDELSREDAIAFIRTVENPISFVVQSMTPIRKPYFSSNGLQDHESKQEPAVLNELSKQEEEEPYENGVVQMDTEKGAETPDKMEKEQAPAQIESEASEDEDENELESHDSETIKQKFAKIENKIEVEVERGPHGLGICLAGHRNRNRMAVFVCGINPNSSLYQTGGIQVGDELLQVNDSVLYGHSHLNASSIIKRLAGPYTFLLSRRKAAINELAVPTVTYFPPVLEEETSQQKYENYPNVRDVSVEKGTSTLGIMIIEGKHAELGHGIFVSDILDNSPAEKAGLEIGELILGVNKQSLVGASYDEATQLLKRAEGLVFLTLSAPTKIITETPLPPDDTADTRKLSSAVASAQPSRAATPVPVDPATCSLIPGQKTTIEITMNNKALGVFLACSKDSSKSKSIFVVDVYNGGCADQDGRLQPGDEILEASEIVLKDMPTDMALAVLHQIEPTMKMVVLRPQTVKYETVEAELVKTPGKGIGLSMLGRKNDKGTFVFEMLEGGNAECDGRIAKGDILVSVNETNVENSSADEVGAVLKIVTGKVALIFNRHSSTVR